MITGPGAPRTAHGPVISLGLRNLSPRAKTRLQADQTAATVWRGEKGRARGRNVIPLISLGLPVDLIDLRFEPATALVGCSPFILAALRGKRRF